MGKEIRTLMASEVEARVKTWDKQAKTWAMLLLYKDARVDQRIMDETFGAMNWQRSHEVVNGNLFCTVSVYNDKAGCWVSKQDVGTESDTEKEKGQASDAFKRACFNWGVGRELYSAPKIFIKTDDRDYDTRGNFKTDLTVTKISYDDKREIVELEISDKSGVRYSYPDSKAPAKKEVSPKVEKEVSPKVEKETKTKAQTPPPATTAAPYQTTPPEGWSVAMCDNAIADITVRTFTTKADLTNYHNANYKALEKYTPYRIKFGALYKSLAQ